jgi:hypothetical protein
MPANDNETTKDEAQETQIDPPIVRASDYRTIYANATRIGLSAYDVRLTFGIIVEAEPGKAVNQDQITVIMSPQHAKAVIKIMQDNLPIWEAQYGKMPDAKTKSLSNKIIAQSSPAEEKVE